MIEINNVSKTFYDAKNEVRALKHLNLKIAKGEIFGIIGMSGAGKSTLLRCLCGLEKPDSGEIIIQNSSKHKAELLGVVFQGYSLLMQSTAGENIAFPLKLYGLSKNEIDARVDKLLSLVGLEGKKNTYPAKLSGGQKQRVAIARAIALNPKVLLCDEPSAALDAVSTQNMIDLLKEINRSFGVTIVVITHELGLAHKLCGRVGVMDDGTIAECGLADEVFSSPKASVTRLLLERVGV